jgi:trimeric autotransporter adhesin
MQNIYRALTLSATMLLLTCLSTSHAAAQYCRPTLAGVSDLPEHARAAISKAIGRDQTVYQAQEQSGGFHMQNGTLSADFGQKGASLQFANDHWTTRAVGFGYGSELRETKTIGLTSHANRVEFRRNGLTEWYENGPLGLEQGFTLARAPGLAHGQPLTVAIELPGNFQARLDGSRKNLTLSRNGGALLHYGGLTAVDANGRELRSWMEVGRDRLLLRVDDTKASYPVTIDPLLQVASMTACDTIDWDAFGSTAAISADGSTVVVGSNPWGASGCPLCTGVGPQTSAAYVFVRPSSRTGWFGPNLVEAQAKLIPYFSGASFEVSSSVSISGDGSTIAIVEPGTVFIYVEPSTGWGQSSPMTQTAALTPSNMIPDNYWSVALSTDGSTIVAGSNLSGTADVFVKPSTGWSSTSKETAALLDALTAAGAIASDNFGESVSVSDDGSTVLVGAPSWNNTGAVYVFVRQESGWADSTASIQLAPSDSVAQENTGLPVSVSGDGSTVVAGAQGSARAYIFTKPATGWANGAQTAELTPSGTASTFGNGVATSEDGTTIAVSAQTSIYVFKKPALGWANASGVPQNPAGDHSGWAISMNSNGGLILGTNVGQNGFKGNANLFEPVTSSPFGGLLSAVNVTEAVGITQGSMVSSPIPGLYSQKVTVVNTSGNTIKGPISFVLDNLSGGAILANLNGITLFTIPWLSPYVISNSDLESGQTASFNLEFIDLTRGAIAYTARVLSGWGQ